MLLFAVACGSERRNSEGALLPEFDEFVLCSADEGLYSVDIRYQRIANADKSDVLAAIDRMNYLHTFDECAVEPADVEYSAQLLVEEYASSCTEIDGVECLGCSYTLDQQALLCRDDSVVCFETCVDIYSGGAHGGTSLLCECYDVATGRLYDFGYLVDGEWAAAVRGIIYDRLSALCDGLLFLASADDVYIPRSAQLTDDGLLLVYQPYEVAAYDEGIISVELSDEELAAVGAPLLWRE